VLSKLQLSQINISGDYKNTFEGPKMVTPWARKLMLGKIKSLVVPKCGLQLGKVLIKSWANHLYHEYIKNIIH
jgi:hypothetical protein